MSPLLLNSIEIENFRAFKNLKIESLGRVNLIVGKNNVGKSSLLEAIQVYAARNHVTLWQMLANREEGDYPTEVSKAPADQKLKTVRFLYHGRQDFSYEFPPIQIGEIGSKYKRITIEFKSREIDDPDEFRPSLIIRSGNNLPVIDRFDTARPTTSDIEGIQCNFVPAVGLNQEEVDLLWSRVALTDDESEVLKAIKIVSPEIEAVGIVSNPELGMRRIAIARSTEIREPFSIQSLGDGINRLFYIALALVNSRNGFLLIDEIGSGLHYSVQHELWRLIFAVAAKLNVQVFATTHSNDSIVAFQIASQESSEEGVLIRLEKRNQIIVPILFDENRLSVATREEIEVR